MGDVVICLFSAAGYDRTAQGVISAGRRLASLLGGRLYAVTIGKHNPELNVRVAAGSDFVISADQAELIDYQPESTLDALKQICRELSPSAILFGPDTYSRELAPRLAYRMGGSAAGDAVELSIHDGLVRIRRAVYEGRALATVELKRSPAVVWVRPHAFEPLPVGSSIATVRQARLKLREDDQVRIVERRTEQRPAPRAAERPVVVSGGGGLGGPEAFEELEHLAGLLGAEVAASRAACDSGWCPTSWEVGQKGKKVSPELYLAIAIRGSSRHLAGISGAKIIAAINIDPDAPIFRHCRFGIVEDYKKVLPMLRERLAALRQAQTAS
ncbi:MAG TPA: electron transfer flavoprotein subunit alpha/FixB family protein [Blastocatellia bacterium]|nr:electron transfer flavoprotein subunit alpha/FixB family protein [Blastocatellia bacterium]